MKFRRMNKKNPINMNSYCILLALEILLIIGSIVAGIYIRQGCDSYTCQIDPRINNSSNCSWRILGTNYTCSSPLEECNRTITCQFYQSDFYCYPSSMCLNQLALVSCMILIVFIIVLGIMLCCICYRRQPPHHYDQFY